MSEEFDIAVWCKQVGISENGAKKLLTAEVRDDLAISLLEAEDVASIKLARATWSSSAMHRACLGKSWTPYLNWLQKMDPLP